MMRRIRLRWLAVSLGAVVAMFGLTPTASATTGDLGGMTLAEYCQSMHFQGARSQPRDGNSWPWVCYSGRTFVPLDPFAECRWQFFDLVGAGFNVRYLGPNGRCWAFNATNYSVPSDLRRLPDYCRSLGYSNVTLTTHNVASWRCVASSGALVPFDMHAACRWVNSGLVAQGFSLVSYFNHYGDAFGIKCLSMKHT